jgi:Tfp pilus assembly protein PilF
VALEALGRLDEAIEAYRKAMELKADHIDALANLGAALSRKGEHEEAIGYLRKFADLRPRSGPARKSLGNALRRAGRAPEAVTAYRMAIELNPKDADSYNNLGAALQESGRIPEAEEALRTCLIIKPDHPDAHWNRGLALLSMGRWREGWMEYEWRQHLREDVGQKRNFPQPVWKGSPLEGRTLLVICEQGLGDTIQFIRYVPMLVERGAKVVVECQAKLKPLIEGLVVGNDAETRGRGDAETGGKDHVPAIPISASPRHPVPASSFQVVAKGEPLGNFDMHARLLTLPGIFDSTPEALPDGAPYLKVEQRRVERCRKMLETGREGEAPVRQSSPQAAEPIASPLAGFGSAGASPSLKVGIVWQGNTAHKGDRFRSIPLSKFAPLAAVEGVELISLQKGFGSEQIEANKELVPLREWSDAQDLTADALLDTAAMMQCLDLVITIDTSIAHLAGALAVPVWVAMPLANDWRWLLEREETPWYPTMRLFRQSQLGDWDEVIERLAEGLKEKIDITSQATEAMVA